MLWVIIGALAWLALGFMAMKFAAAAAKPWPGDTERFREDRNG